MYYILLKPASPGQKRITDKNFKKIVFLKENKEEGITLALVQYLGSHALSTIRSHGNSKDSTSIFIPTKPSVKLNLETKIETNSLKSSHKIYKEEIVKPVESVLDQPRNTRQVRYLRQKVADEDRISKDAIINIHAMAYEDSTFVHSIVTYPDLIVCCGLKEVMEELKIVLDSAEACQQQLSYDTTFSVGEFYVSPLIFKNIIFKEAPAIPVLFLIHERKLTAHHKVLFELLSKEIKRPKLKDVPITIDMEIGIRLAIEAETPLQVVGCWRHLSDSVKRWVSGHGGKKDDQRVYIDHLFKMLNCKIETEYLELYESFKDTWSESFVDYFESNVHDKMQYHARFAVEEKVKMTENGITTNVSEGFNFLIKDLQEWKERPIDCIMLSFRFLQQYLLREIQRGRAGVGNFHLVSSEYAIDIYDVDTAEILGFEDIVTNIKDGTYITNPSQVLKKDSVAPSNTFKAKALELINSNKVHLIPQNKCFSVMSGPNYYSVALSKPKAKCTCPNQKICSHIVACYLSLGIEPDESILNDASKVINLTTLRKNARGSKAKPGRKKHRAGDYDVEPAEDSAAKKAKLQEEAPSFQPNGIVDDEEEEGEAEGEDMQEEGEAEGEDMQEEGEAEGEDMHIEQEHHVSKKLFLF